jgi:hypothetical protein
VLLIINQHLLWALLVYYGKWVYTPLSILPNHIGKSFELIVIQFVGVFLHRLDIGDVVFPRSRWVFAHWLIIWSVVFIPSGLLRSAAFGCWHSASIGVLPLCPFSLLLGFWYKYGSSAYGFKVLC